jgi:hypothetical protein
MDVILSTLGLCIPNIDEFFGGSVMDSVTFVR